MNSENVCGVPRNTISVPQILLPCGADMYSWAVNACDQFTSDLSYWQEVERIAQGKPSAYHIIFPEIYLKDNPEARIAAINSQMYRYLESGIFSEFNGFVLVERTTESGTRTGIVLAIDLEQYSFRQEDKALIRSTEATVLDRLPPRVHIRSGAPLELPHIMLLYDDKSRSVLNSVRRGEELYNFDLNMGGGHVKGTLVSDPQTVIDAFYSLAEGMSDKMLFAVGDGNHSLAAAKLCWENIKNQLSPEQAKTHPARYALCEAVNIYDPALAFRPIHRFIKTDNPHEFVGGWNISGEKSAEVVVNGIKTAVSFPSDIPCGIRLVDEYISDFIKKYGGTVDYIHGDEELTELTADGAGVLLPSVEKDDFFRLIKAGGNLPKKTFSMGEGNEKRYYIEAKRIK